MKKMEQPSQSSRDERRGGSDSSRNELVRNAEQSSGRESSDRSPARDDLILHDDDEAELELPR